MFKWRRLNIWLQERKICPCNFCVLATESSNSIPFGFSYSLEIPKDSSSSNSKTPPFVIFQIWSFSNTKETSAWNASCWEKYGTIPYLATKGILRVLKGKMAFVLLNHRERAHNTELEASLRNFCSLVYCKCINEIKTEDSTLVKKALLFWSHFAKWIIQARFKQQYNRGQKSILFRLVLP